MQISKKFAVLFGILGLAAGTAGTVALQTHAATTGSSGTSQTIGNKFFHPPALAAFGNVTAVNGNTVTITDSKNNTTYTVDASGAAVTGKTPIAVGDSIAVQGTVNGTTITATKIMDGMMGRGFRGGPGIHAISAAGTVSAINGNTITLTGKNGSTTTVTLAVGDTIMVKKNAAGQ